MTPQQIDALPAGRELDALVLVHACGWKWWRYKQANYKCWLTPPGLYVEDEKFGPIADWPDESQRFSDWTSSRSTEAPHVSTDIADAWTVAEAMKAKIMLWSDAEGITCRFHTDEMMAESCSASAPLSICRAALKFVFAAKAQEASCKT